MKNLLWICCIGLFPMSLWAQTGRITGNVTNAADGSTIPGATVRLEGTTLGAATNEKGIYTIIGLQEGRYVLIASSIGFKSEKREIVVGDATSNVDFSLAEDILGTEEVIVTGLASRTSRERNEVAVSRVDAEKLAAKGVAYQDISQLVNGKVAGVGVSTASGNVSSGWHFNVRDGGSLTGGGEPAIYLDGIRVLNFEVRDLGLGGQGISSMADINPADIASVDFLKGPAAAALYGTSGTNGVVIITTKRGALAASGGVLPLNVNYKFTNGTNQQAQAYTLQNASTPDTINRWFRSGEIREHAFDVSGGSAAVRYFTSFNHRDEQGQFPQDALKRDNFRLNLDVFPAQNLSVSLSSAFSKSDIVAPQNDNNLFGILGNTTLAPKPYNFLDSAAIANVLSQDQATRFLGSLRAEYSPAPNFKIVASVGYDNMDRREDQTFPRAYAYSGRTSGSRFAASRRNTLINYDLNGAYSWHIQSKLLSVTTFGAQASNTTSRVFNLFKDNFSTDLITAIQAGASFRGLTEGFTDSRDAGLFLQEELSYQNLYFLTLGGRRDMASTIGDDAPNIFYPKISAAIRLDHLLPKSFNLFKLRAAFGQTGGLPDATDRIPLRWAAVVGGYGVGGVISSIGNTTIEPERTQELEIGLDISLMDRLRVELTGYKRDVLQSILNAPNAPSTGLTASAIPTNAGKAEGSGFEALLELIPFRTPKSELNLTLTWSGQRNKITDMDGLPPLTDGLNVIKSGLPRAEFYGQAVLGAEFDASGKYLRPLVSSANDIIRFDPQTRTFSKIGVNDPLNPTTLAKYEQIADGSNKVDLYANPIPSQQGALSLNLKLLRNLNIYALAEWKLGQFVQNDSHRFRVQFGGDAEVNTLKTNLGLSCGSTPCDATATTFAVGSSEYKVAAEQYARLNNGYPANFVESANFLRLREVAVRYNFNGFLKASGWDKTIRNLSLSFSGRNLFLSSTFSGIDPEINFSGSRTLAKGQEFLTAPLPKTIVGTLSLGF